MNRDETREANAAALAWAAADRIGATRAICTADSLRAIRLQYVSLRRAWPARDADGRAARGRVRAVIASVRLAVRAIDGGALLSSPRAFL